MMKPLKIKVCGMRARDNLMQLMELQPDYVGFIFYPPSARYVGEDFSEDIPNLVVNAKKVGVFVNASPEEVLQKVKHYHLDMVQLHGSENMDECRTIKDAGVEVIKAFQIDDSFDFNVLQSYEAVTDYFLFDTKSSSYGGSGQKFDWSVLKNYKFDKPFFLSGGIGSEDVSQLAQLKLNHLFALDLNSKFEDFPAIKNIKLLSDFIRGIRN